MYMSRKCKVMQSFDVIFHLDNDTEITRSFLQN